MASPGLRKHYPNTLTVEGRVVFELRMKYLHWLRWSDARARDEARTLAYLLAGWEVWQDRPGGFELGERPDVLPNRSARP